ncbi:MAG: REP-associated tyrosine transposase [Rhodanobacteraceae bacterium]
MSRGPGHKALRKGRCSQRGGVYLVTFTTARRRRVFADFAMACAACRTFEESAAAEDAVLLSWVLMPDHFHGLIRLDGDAALSSCVQRIKSRSAKACTKIGSPRPLWARAFHDHAARRDEDTRRLARYIVCNPVRAGIVARVNDYPFWDAAWV